MCWRQSLGRRAAAASSSAAWRWRAERSRGAGARGAPISSRLASPHVLLPCPRPCSEIKERAKKAKAAGKGAAGKNVPRAAGKAGAKSTGR